MILTAVVERVWPNRLLVIDRSNFQNVIVNTNQTRCFMVGDIVSILYNGEMTRSIPPQIFAIRIWRLFPRRNCR